MTLDRYQEIVTRKATQRDARQVADELAACALDIRALVATLDADALVEKLGEALFHVASLSAIHDLSLEEVGVRSCRK